ncbi:MAG TPA: hypothetical protein VGM31_17620, partial [Puia sp.]
MTSRNNHYIVLLCAFVLSQQAPAQPGHDKGHSIQSLDLREVRIDDGFWGPRMSLWSSRTVYDVLDKLEGKYNPDRPGIIAEKNKLGRTRNAFLNFDRVARGEKNTQTHDGPP